MVILYTILYINNTCILLDLHYYYMIVIFMLFEWHLQTFFLVSCVKY